MSKLVEWYDMEGGDPIGAYEWGEGEDPICPYCEKEAHYWERKRTTGKVRWGRMKWGTTKKPITGCALTTATT